MFVNTARQQMFKTTTRGSFQKLVGAQCRGQRRSFAWNTNSNGRNVVVVDGIRLPFAQASTIYKDEMAVDLQRMAIKGLLTKTALNKNDIDYVICGTVIQEVRTSNIAREASLNAGLPNSIGSHTVAQVFIVQLYLFFILAFFLRYNKSHILLSFIVDDYCNRHVSLPTQQFVREQKRSFRVMLMLLLQEG
jgi:hypothetical protein